MSQRQIEIKAKFSKDYKQKKQVRGKHLNLQPVRQVNQSFQAPFRKNRQHQQVGQVKLIRYLGYNQAKMDLECNQIGRKTTRNRCSQNAPNILQRIEQEYLMEHCQIGKSNHQQVASQTIQLGSQWQAYHPNYNNYFRRRDLLTYTQGQYKTARDRQSYPDQERHQLCSHQHRIE